MRVLVADPVAQEGIELLRQGAEVDVVTGLAREELIERIAQYDGLVVRSETKVTAEVIAAAERLKVVARAGVGVDNIDVDAATRRGVVVVNSPDGNTVAAAEQTIALLFGVARNTPQAHQSVKAGKWERSRFLGVELYGKVLGVVGLGKIGQQVARRARGLEMRVVVSDPYVTTEHAQRLGVELVELPQLLAMADFLTIHVPLTKETRHLISDTQFDRMKTGVRLVNCARGGVVDEAALLRAIESGKVAAAALDVFEKEPLPADSPLLRCEKVITTPHLGASTREAQVNVSVDVAEQVLDVLQGRPARSAINSPSVSPEMLGVLEPFLRLSEKIGRLQAQLADGRISGVEVTYSGDLADLETAPLTRALLKGLLDPAISGVNYVSAPVIAEGRGIRVTETRSASSEDYTSLITVTVRSDKEPVVVSGTLFGKHDIRIVSLDGYRIDVEPEGYLLFMLHRDRPGVIGLVGTLLGQHNVNIAGMNVGRESIRGNALMALKIDEAMPPDLLPEIQQVPGVRRVRLVEL
ncbi:MAG: phosphoglycerate dehydrogenase [Armatimonadetes bacterium]|nr:phosphoglycerate dehydrogenase [Armatimonadota bacterium]